MTKKETFDYCYAGFQDGKLVLTQAFGASIAQTYRKLGLRVPDTIRGRACDAAPAAPARVSPVWARFRARRAARALDAVPTPASDSAREARLRAHQWIVRFRAAAQAFDAQPALPRQPDYRALQAAYKAKRNG